MPHTFSSLHISNALHNFVHDELLPDTGLSVDDFWQSFAEIVRDFQPKNAELLAARDHIQRKLDDWFRQHQETPDDALAQETFLRVIGYLVPKGEDFLITTNNVDLEISSIAGPQLVVPVNNARYALNAANARWGSLYDALYGTDAIQPLDPNAGDEYDPARGQQVFDSVDEFLDETFPLSKSWNQVSEIAVADSDGTASLELKTASGATALHDSDQFVGYQRDDEKLTSILLWHNGLHVELCIDRDHRIGKEHHAGIRDVVLEAAVTTIQDTYTSRGSVVAFPVDADGRIGECLNRLEHPGRGGSDSDRQLASHPHCVVVGPEGQFAAVADLGIDKVMVYRIQSHSPGLQLVSEIVGLAGQQPRHLAWHPSGRFLYCMNEGHSTVSVIEFDRSAGKGRFIQHAKRIRGKGGGGADLRIDSTGRFVYGSNRGEDTIVVFAVCSDSGKVSLVGHVACGSSTRSIVVSPDDRWLVAANQGSGDVRVFSIDRETGNLASTPHRLTVRQPACVLFRGGSFGNSEARDGE